MPSPSTMSSTILLVERASRFISGRVMPLLDTPVRPVTLKVLDSPLPLAARSAFIPFVAAPIRAKDIGKSVTENCIPSLVISPVIGSITNLVPGRRTSEPESPFSLNAATSVSAPKPMLFPRAVSASKYKIRS